MRKCGARGRGADIRRFDRLRHGNDTIEGFEVTNGFELMDFSNFAALDSVDTVLASAQQNGADVLITTGVESSILLIGVTLADLGADDFVF
ncbi:MAG: hypothetical protein ABJX32_02940 [Tateyamaria sp.]|uniref:hypothetical protein n=1 Tax=Tateyamaria sp. TaxID=1929288 RepID=UPI0032A06A60